MTLVDAENNGGSGSHEEGGVEFMKIRDYDREEERAGSSLIPTLVHAFQNARARDSAYPWVVSEEYSFQKFIDISFSSNPRDFYSEILEGITPEEFDEVQRIWGYMLQFSEQRCGRLALPVTALLEALNVLRHIRLLYPNQSPSVFEFQAGSGYLGALLHLAGSPYAGSESSQGLYLFQNRIWSYVLSSRLREHATGTQRAAPSQLAPIMDHYPWWKLPLLMTDRSARFDVVTCNGGISNLPPETQRIIIELSARLLADSSRPHRAFVLDTFGSFDTTLKGTTLGHLYNCGFSLIYTDRKITILVPTDVAGGAGWRWNPAVIPEEYRAERHPMCEALAEGKRYSADEQTIPFEQLETLLTVLGLEND